MEHGEGHAQTSAVTVYNQHYVLLTKEGVNCTAELIQIIENNLFQNSGIYTKQNCFQTILGMQFSTLFEIFLRKKIQ